MKKKSFKKQQYTSNSILFSGGQDSSLLLFLFLIKKSKENFSLVTINHEFQFESNLLFSHVFFLSIILQKSLNFSFLKFSQEKLFLKKNENNLRLFRYQISLRNNVFYKNFLLSSAHTKTDLIETLFLNLCRGTGLKGLTLNFNRVIVIFKNYHNFLNFLLFLTFFTIKKNAYYTKKTKTFYLSINFLNKNKLIRPLVDDYSRLTIFKLNTLLKTSLFIDKSNIFLILKRNRIRRHLLIYIQTFLNPNFEFVIYSSSIFLRKELFSSCYKNLMIDQKKID